MKRPQFWIHVLLLPFMTIVGFFGTLLIFAGNCEQVKKQRKRFMEIDRETVDPDSNERFVDEEKDRKLWMKAIQKGED